MVKKSGLLVIIISLIFTGIQAQDFETEKLDTLCNRLFREQRMMGSLAIRQDGALVYSNGFGYRLKTDDIANEIDTKTQFRIGSISKMFTATLIFSLIEEGKLNLDTRLSEYFPEVKNAKEISVDLLLGHRSGIHNFTNDPEYREYMTKAKTREEMVDIIVDAGSDFEPDSKAQYSNSNYVLLGYILEEASGKAYEELLKERIVKPLGLTHTEVGSKIKATQNQAFPHSLEEGNWEVQSQTDMSIPGGAGAIISTPIDLTKFIKGLFSYKIISPPYVQQMKTIKDRYGRGLFKMPFQNRIAYGHTGGIDEFASSLAYFPEEKLAIAFSGNAFNYTMNEMLIEVMGVVFGTDMVIPDFKQEKLSEEQLQKYEGFYTSDQIPLNITVTHANGFLKAQASGQPEFTLDYTGENTFIFNQAGVKLTFSAMESGIFHQMEMEQGGQTFIYQRSETEKDE